MYIYLYKCIYIYICKYIYMYKYTYIHTRLYIYIYTCIYIYIYTNIHIHTYTHIYITYCTLTLGVVFFVHIYFALGIEQPNLWSGMMKFVCDILIGMFVLGNPITSFLYENAVPIYMCIYIPICMYIYSYICVYIYMYVGM